MKEILIREISNDLGIITRIQIVSQTHRCENFGTECGDGRVFQHKGFALKSFYKPQVGVDLKTLFVKGSDYIRDDNILKVPSQKWLMEAEAAIAAYNIFFMSCKICKERHCNKCKISRCNSEGRVAVL